MLQTKPILVMSTDSMLLETRSRILENAGYPVVRAMTLEDAERELTKQRMALLLLCHTLSSDQCKRAIEIAHNIDPDVMTIALAATSGPCIRMSDVALHQLSGPRKLVETVRAALC